MADWRKFPDGAQAASASVSSFRLLSSKTTRTCNAKRISTIIIIIIVQSGIKDEANKCDFIVCRHAKLWFDTTCMNVERKEMSMRMPSYLNSDNYCFEKGEKSNIYENIAWITLMELEKGNKTAQGCETTLLLLMKPLTLWTLCIAIKVSPSDDNWVKNR
jgi:hypothetical protein